MEEDENSGFNALVPPLITLGGIVGLNLPCIASRLPANTGLGSLKCLGFPFNMRGKTLDRHFSYSVNNLMEGRYYTCVTCLFNHAGVHHFASNMIALINYGLGMHLRYGCLHLLTTFFGGGIAGCAGQYLAYTYQRFNWETILPPPQTWSRTGALFGETILSKLHGWQTKALSNIFLHVNGYRLCVGCSGALSAIMAVEVGRNIEYLLEKVQEPEVRLDFNTIYSIVQLVLISRIFYEDLMILLGTTAKDQGILSSLIAYSVDGVGHSAHLGGFVFGLVYFGLILSRRNKRKKYVK